jgi:hypothetical protein
MRNARVSRTSLSMKNAKDWSLSVNPFRDLGRRDQDSTSTAAPESLLFCCKYRY